MRDIERIDSEPVIQAVCLGDIPILVQQKRK